MGKMELEKRKIYMDRMKYRAGTQIALEDDRNLQDNKPDIARILGISLSLVKYRIGRARELLAAYLGKEKV